ncbi:unnamed protein product [Peniophora sp. CBMAI 1063]|nr:unnamed protein product [Peniophora sp. CBMAI 1063]
MPRVPRSRCAYAMFDEPVKPKRAPAKKRSEMTEDEKEEADIMRIARKGIKIAKDEWEKALPAPWAGPEDFKWPTGTIGIYKSDAKSSFGLTDKDIMTLRHEAISGSPKTFYSLIDVKNLSFEKFAASALSLDFKMPGQPKNGTVRIFQKTDHSPNRRTRTNWRDLERASWFMVERFYMKDDPMFAKSVAVEA